jgi:hypothetical protein
MKKTAVTQLIEQLTAVGALEIPEGTNAISMIIAEAKEAEECQTVDFAWGFSFDFTKEELRKEFKETFKTK